MAKITKKINDFGDFIPGCFKYHGAMTLEEFEKMSEAEQRLKAKRESVWPAIDAEDLVKNGEDNFLVYIKTRIRRMTFATPNSKNDDFTAVAKAYVKTLSEVRDAVMNLKDENEVYTFCRSIRREHPEWSYCLELYKVQSITWNMTYMRNRCIELNFPYNTKKKADERKKAFKLTPLENIEREGTDYRKGINSTEKKWENAFQFKGVVFGNAVTQKERQDNLNYGFDGIKDLAIALDIADSDVSFGGRLNISFGARGRGHADGHYECLYEVINMTRIRGAGTFAKLWFHALDDILAKKCGITSGHLASQADENEKKLLPASFNALMYSIKMDDAGVTTSFYDGSGTFNKLFMKGAYGGWDSGSEMVARAFACYLKDCICNKSDYIIAHADSYHWEYEDAEVYAVPQGEERKFFNERFEDLFDELKAIGFFHKRPIELPKPKPERKRKKDEEQTTSSFHYDENVQFEQMCLFA